jgi:hypothetical protein
LDRWGIKQPLTSLVLPIYRDVFNDLGLVPRYVVCVRNPLEVMDSESRLDFEDSYRVMQSLGTMVVGSWLRYTLGSVADADTGRMQVVLYDDLLRDPGRVLQGIVASHGDWAPSEEQWADAVGSIKSDLRHNVRPIEELDGFPAIVRSAWEAVLIAARGDSESRDRGLARLRELYAEFQAYVGMFDDTFTAPGKLGLSWVVNGERSVSETEYDPANTWQVVRLTLDAPPNTLTAGLLYGLPARIWIRRCIWRIDGRAEEATLRSGPCSPLNRVEGCLRLDTAFEAGQIRLVTPSSPGPYELEMEFLVETGSQVYVSSAARLARQLEQCVSEVLGHRSGRAEA